MHRFSLLWGLVVGCAEDDSLIPAHPCASDTVGLEVAPPEGDFGDLAEGGLFWVGDPPQGGAPFSPFRIRVSGPDAMFDGVDVNVRVVGTDGTLITEDSVEKGLTCANVGENAGLWVGSEVHLRYYGFVKEELHGLDVEVEVEVIGGEDDELVAVERGAVTLSID